MKTKKVGSSGRMGPRYGWKLRRQIRDVETKARSTYNCTHGGKPGLKRTSTGIWKCSKCGSVFAGGAYAPRAAQSTPGR
jgi:large subunit ribosomal protein L37Ae